MINNEKNVNIVIFKFIVWILTITLALSSPPEDLISDGVPGYSANFKQRVFSGYLSTSSDSRKIHYIFI